MLGEYQGGFRKGRGTEDHIFLLTPLLTSCYEYNIASQILYILIFKKHMIAKTEDN